ncbi:MAG: hypothetical protein ABIK09_12845 [Pseudomonadota bacterium]
MRNPTPLLIPALALLLLACGDDSVPTTPVGGTVTPRNRPVDGPPTAEPRSEPRARSRLSLETPRGAGEYESAYSHPESLLKPLDGFPLPSGTHLQDHRRDLAVYEVGASLDTVESFYRERGFRITRPGKLPGLIITRTDTGTRLQVQPGKHRMIQLRFYR